MKKQKHKKKKKTTAAEAAWPPINTRKRKKDHIGFDRTAIVYRTLILIFLQPNDTLQQKAERKIDRKK